MEKALRRARSDLALSGVGSIAFGVWYFVKTVLYNLFAREYINNLFGLVGAEGIVRPVLLTLWLVLSAFIMAAHLYVGLSAVSEGTGKAHKRHPGRLYLLLAGVLLLSNGNGLIASICTFAAMEGSLLDQICDIMMETVRRANMAALIYAALRTRKLTQRAEEEAAVHAD